MPDDPDRIAAVAALDQPLRRDLYRRLGTEWVTRDEAADAAVVPRAVAAFHLDKLAEAGLVETSFARPSGRGGPGAGRPAKRYRRSTVEVAASVPDRRYDVAGKVLATAVADAGRTGRPIAVCVRRAARDAGQRLAGDHDASAGGVATRRARVIDLLAAQGYEPAPAGRNEIVLMNCPFHRLADAERDLVCGMNLDLLTAVAESVDGAGRVTARLEPEPGRCCVTLRVA